MNSQLWRLLDEYQTTSQRISVFIALVIIMIFITVADYFAGKYIALFTLYIIPIMIATWKIGLKSGIFFSLAACFAGFSTQFALEPESQGVYILTSTLVRMGVLSLLVYSGWKIKILVRLLDKVAEEDFLTGLLNRRGFFLHGQLELERMIRARQSISMVYIDIDNFKWVNDNKGHGVGDKLIQELAKTIKENIRRTDIVARLGGDEFVIMLLSSSSIGALQVAKKIFTAIQKKPFSNDYIVGVSMGIASFNTSPNSLEYALKCADDLMYKVKQANKNGILQGQF